MREHPIEGIMLTTMNSIREMIDVNTIIGEPIETLNNITIIPISKVGVGFASGGSEFSLEAVDEYNKKEKEEEISYKLPFWGGSGAGISIIPVAFLVVQEDSVKLIPVNHSSAIDKLLDYVPDLMEKVKEMIDKKIEKNEKKEEFENDLEKEIKEKIQKERLKEENSKNSQGTGKVHPKRNKQIKFDYQYDDNQKGNIADDNDDLK